VGIMKDSKDVQRACRLMSLTLDRGLTTPSGRVRSFRGAKRPEPCRLPSTLGQKHVEPPCIINRLGRVRRDDSIPVARVPELRRGGAMKTPLPALLS
jgi:hypothetical protein